MHADTGYVNINGIPVMYAAF